MRWTIHLALIVGFCASCTGDWGISGGDQPAQPDVVGPGPDIETTDSTHPDITPPDPGQSDPGLVHDEGPDLTPPQVISAFSPDGKGVTVRFSEPVDPATASVAANYAVKGSAGAASDIPVLAASPKGAFVTLTLDQSKPINPDLTYEVFVSNVTDLAGNPVDAKARKAKVKRSVYVAIVWHQHQPLYASASGEELSGPWVRKHATKDYYDMAAMLANYPDVHLTINLTPVLLSQLTRYYLERLGDVGDDGLPLVDIAANRVREEQFLKKYRGKTDPFIDLLLDDTPDPLGKVAPKPTDRQLELFYNSPWSCLSTSDAIMNFFPQYKALRDRPPMSYTHDDLLLLKIMFEIAWFDPDFLNGPVKMPDGNVVDLSDLVKRQPDGTYILAVEPSEDMANRLVAENYKVMKNVVPIHKALRYDPDARTGQIEVSTTPFYHPILPLIYSTDQARKSQPYDNLPSPPFSYPDDAMAHVAKSVKYYQDLFGQPPKGMWPGEGSVAEVVVDTFVKNGLTWIATDQQILANTLKDMGQPTPPCFQCQPYRITGSAGDMAIVFRDTEISNKVGFTFAGLFGQQAASEFMKDIAARAPAFGGSDRLVTVILDGENAWESFVKEHDAKGFFYALYQALEDGYKMGEVVPVTVAEYILGNPDRNVPPHPVAQMKELEPLWPGSWIGGDFSVWIGEPEENSAWGYLLKTRQALELSGLPRPNLSADKPAQGDNLTWYAWNAWEEMYAAEGSDWFWWYGDDMTSPANDDSPFDMAFRGHLNGVFTNMNLGLQKQGKPTVKVPDFPPLVQGKAKAPAGPFPTPPTPDGQENPPGEWSDGGLFYDNDSGAIANPDDHIASVKYGYTNTTFYVALVMNEDMSKKAGSQYAVAIYFSHKHILDVNTGQFEQNPFNTTDRWGRPLGFLMGGAAFEVMLDFSQKPPKATLSKADGAGGFGPASGDFQTGGPVPGGKILEFAIPYKTLGIVMGDPLEFEAVVMKDGKAIDWAPNLTGKVVFEDPTTLVYVTFVVDVSGSTIALDTYGPINNKPQPQGKGIVYIAGNQDKLGLWIPNKISLHDDGKNGDEKAGDSLWSGTFGFMPGTLLRYKYTIGIPTDEAKWAGTEEFPLTERGLDVTKDPNCKKMRVRDIFADRPQPTGTAGPHSVIENCVK